MTPVEALDVLKTYLRTLKTVEQYPVDEDGDHEDKNGFYTSESSPAAMYARAWAHELLREADANGLGGCRLCQG